MADNAESSHLIPLIGWGDRGTPRAAEIRAFPGPATSVDDEIA